ncbi:Glutaredoxin-1 [Zancudomyces culisetae]|uniref:Glutaredoxin-1 n=1 Tax=Zancudomyces culisetae TaxID=1213189 RepID=A0A1R1PN23_ZANCU|nr:Glutaredoxin-1 [Zancudomyces culisetae]OMH82303.1 Glutaredoxin-1 [Zancudomyces culisetae]|eukprot:OMH81717.1 Glutaredoxin-1 [Zancudomyces culisetae]
MKMVKDQIKATISSNPVVMYSKSTCPQCTQAKTDLEKNNLKAKIIEIDTADNGREIQKALKELTRKDTVPSIFINKRHIGGANELSKKLASGELKQMLE